MSSKSNTEEVPQTVENIENTINVDLNMEEMAESIECIEDSQIIVTPMPVENPWVVKVPMLVDSLQCLEATGRALGDDAARPHLLPEMSVATENTEDIYIGDGCSDADGGIPFFSQVKSCNFLKSMA